MRYLSCRIFIVWLQATSAIYQIQPLELEFLSNNLSPSECVRFYELIRRQIPRINENRTPQVEPYGFGGTLDCKKLLTSWLADPKEAKDKIYERVELVLKQIGRTDLVRWLGYNMMNQNVRGNTGVRYKGEDQGGGNPGKGTSNEIAAKNVSTQTVLQKVIVTVVVILSMTTLCLFFYKILYERMRGGHFTAFKYAIFVAWVNDCFRREFDEESWLHRNQESGRKPRSCCSKFVDTRRSFWDSVDCNLRFSPVEYLKNRFKRFENYLRDKRCRQLRVLKNRLQKTCPTQRKIIHLSRKEQILLKSLTDTEKYQLPATESDLKFLVASDREKRKLLAREARREFLIEFRKRLERMGSDCNRNIILNEPERKMIKKLSSSERMLLPIMDRDLELLASSPLEKREVMLKQMACKLSKIISEDRKYLELDSSEKKFLKETDDKEKRKLGITDSEFRFLIASRSQKSVMQQRLDSHERGRRIKEIRKRLAEVDYDVSCLELSKIEHSTFLSLNSCELAQLGLTEEHVKYYEASDSEKKLLWPSPSQYRNLKINTLQTKLSKLPWKQCGARLTSSEHTLLASLTQREQCKLHISDSEKNFMLSTDSEKELIQRQRKLEKLSAKIRDFNIVTMTESERGLILSLSPSEMQMLNIDSTNKSALLEKRSDKRFHDHVMNRDVELRSLRDKIDKNRHAELTQVERTLLGSLTSSEMAEMHLSISQVNLLLSKGNQCQKNIKIEKIKDRIHREGLTNVRLSNSERDLIRSLSNFEMNEAKITPSQVTFLLANNSEQRMAHHHRHQKAIQHSESATRHGVSFRDTQVNTSPHIHHQQTSNTFNNQTHSHHHTHPSHEHHEMHLADHKHKVQFEEHSYGNSGGNAEGDAPVLTRESTDDSEQSETYDELGMLFSQQMKQQARPCHRKYCRLGRHLRRGGQHDERQCQIRHQCYRGYPSDQRPSCSSGNVCKDAYDEFQLMHATPDQKKQLNSSIYERRKQFLDQPCQNCHQGHDNRIINN